MMGLPTVYDSSCNGAAARVRPLEVVLVDPEVCGELDALDDGARLVLGARILLVRRVVENLRQGDAAINEAESEPQAKQII